MKFISIIPARGGSKRLKRKNIKMLAGKPLISYTIIESLKSERIDIVIVSTEDSEIAHISKDYGAEIIKRPDNLSRDDTPTIDVVFHIIEQIKADIDEPLAIVLLQPTSPLRVVEDINTCIDLFLNNKCESLVSVCKVSHPINWFFRIDGDYLNPLFNKNILKKFTHDYNSFYQLNGAIYIIEPKTLQKYKSFICKNTIPYIMSFERSVDIDNELDLKLAEFFISNEKN